MCINMNIVLSECFVEHFVILLCFVGDLFSFYSVHVSTWMAHRQSASRDPNFMEQVNPTWQEKLFSLNIYIIIKLQALLMYYCTVYCLCKFKLSLQVISWILQLFHWLRQI